MITATDIRKAAEAASAAKAQYGLNSPAVQAALDLYNQMRALRDEQVRFQTARSSMDPDAAKLHERTLALAEARLRYGAESFQARAEEARYTQAQQEYQRAVEEERAAGMRSAAVTGWFGDVMNKLRVLGGSSALLALGVLWFLASSAARKR